MLDIDPIAKRGIVRDSMVRRQTMVDCQIRTFDVTDQALLARFLAVPREYFVPDKAVDLAYSDIGLSLDPEDAGAEARYLLPPLVLARMIQGGRVKPTDRVLDIACGAGYSTAVLAGLAGSVIALESDASFAAIATARLRRFGLDDLTVATGDLAAGLPDRAPFDLILVNGAVETGLDKLLAQLAEGGRLLVIKRAPGDPTGRAAKALCYEKRGAEIGSRYLFDASAPMLRAFRTVPTFVF